MLVIPLILSTAGELSRQIGSEVNDENVNVINYIVSSKLLKSKIRDSARASKTDSGSKLVGAILGWIIGFEVVGFRVVAIIGFEVGELEGTVV